MIIKSFVQRYHFWITSREKKILSDFSFYLINICLDDRSCSTILMLLFNFSIKSWTLFFFLECHFPRSNSSNFGILFFIYQFLYCSSHFCKMTNKKWDFQRLKPTSKEFTSNLIYVLMNNDKNGIDKEVWRARRQLEYKEIKPLLYTHFLFIRFRIWSLNESTHNHNQSFNQLKAYINSMHNKIIV